MNKFQTTKEVFHSRLEKMEKDIHNIVRLRFDELRTDVVECVNCGQLAVGERSGRIKYCSDSCRAAHSRKRCEAESKS